MKVSNENKRILTKKFILSIIDACGNAVVVLLARSLLVTLPMKLFNFSIQIPWPESASELYRWKPPLLGEVSANFSG
jgi:hypothetical protein